MEKNIFQWTCDWARKSELDFSAFKETSSTNDIAKKSFSQTESVLLMIAEHQTEGKGRNNNTWKSPKRGDGFLSSWIFYPPQSPQPITSLLLGLKLFQVAKECWPDLDWSLKAPNDIYLKDKKVGGLLVETITRNKQIGLIVGLGINIFSHPEEELATHLAEHTEVKPEDWEEFLNGLKKEWQFLMPLILKTDLKPEHCEEMKTALNSFPLLDEKILEVSSKGDLFKESGKVSWKAL